MMIHKRNVGKAIVAAFLIGQSNLLTLSASAETGGWASGAARRINAVLESGLAGGTWRLPVVPVSSTGETPTPAGVPVSLSPDQVPDLFATKLWTRLTPPNASDLAMLTARIDWLAARKQYMKEMPCAEAESVVEES